MPYCPHCHETLTEGDNWCSNCGQKITWLTSTRRKPHSDGFVVPPPDSFEVGYPINNLDIMPTSDAGGNYVFCSRCGAEDGAECIGGNQHSFQRYNHVLRCNRCGQFAGYKSNCIGINEWHHDFI